MTQLILKMRVIYRCPALELERTVGLILEILEPEWNTDVDEERSIFNQRGILEE